MKKKQVKKVRSLDYYNCKVICDVLEPGNPHTLKVDSVSNSMRYISQLGRFADPKRIFITKKISDTELKVWRLE